MQYNNSNVAFGLKLPFFKKLKKNELSRKEGLKKLAEIAERKKSQGNTLTRQIDTFTHEIPKVPVERRYRDIKYNFNLEPVEFIRDVNKQIRLNILRNEGIAAYFEYLRKFMK